MFLIDLFIIVCLAPMRKIDAVERGTASLPCDTSPPIPHDPTDTVMLVVWYRNEKTAIYR